MVANFLCEIYMHGTITYSLLKSIVFVIILRVLVLSIEIILKKETFLNH